jgi:hypothetical protein
MALPDTFCLPSKVIGPVLFLALARFANTFFNEITFVTPFFFLYFLPLNPPVDSSNEN